MGQEATTQAQSEPALSFQYDSSQSLYEQLTKAQQTNSSSFSAQQASFPQSHVSESPVMRAMDSMPPPQMIPQSMAPLSDGMDGMVPYNTMTPMAPVMPQHIQQVIKREPDYTRAQYNQNGVPISQGHQRHTSMPAYSGGLEYSPAPSFVSSHLDDYRGISYEPVTPPQQAMGMGAEPAYIANEETGLYTAIPDHMAGLHSLNGMLQLPPSNLAGPQFTRGYTNNNVYSVIEGSPTYKQRRRRSSIPPSMSAIAAATAQAQTAPHRPSDLRRSVSASVGPLAECEEMQEHSPPGLSYSHSSIPIASHTNRDMLEMSRHGTPLSTVEGSPALNPRSLQRQDYIGFTHEDFVGDGNMSEQTVMPTGNHVIRRARSATTSVMELGSPYQQKSHSCPIPTCGRLFKRLEHLKR